MAVQSRAAVQRMHSPRQAMLIPAAGQHTHTLKVSLLAAALSSCELANRARASRYVTELEDKVGHFQRLLAKHAPDVADSRSAADPSSRRGSLQPGSEEHEERGAQDSASPRAAGEHADKDDEDNMMDVPQGPSTSTSSGAERGQSAAPPPPQHHHSMQSMQSQLQHAAAAAAAAGIGSSADLGILSPPTNFLPQHHHHPQQQHGHRHHPYQRSSPVALSGFSGGSPSSAHQRFPSASPNSGGLLAMHHQHQHDAYSPASQHGSATTAGSNTILQPAPASATTLGMPSLPPPPTMPVLGASAPFPPQPPVLLRSAASTHSAGGASEALERQPRNANGYEWNERVQSSMRGNDGTASLSLEPDGEGYLGFASGATLLRILQICAGVSQIDAKKVVSREQSAMPPVGGPDWPSESETAACVDAYFSLYGVQYPLLHEATFRAQWHEVIPPPVGPGYVSRLSRHNSAELTGLCSWDILVNVVLSLGAFVSFRSSALVDHFLEKALDKLGAAHLEAGNLTLVQAFTLLSNISQKRNKPNAGQAYLGCAVRMAIGLGLHRESPQWRISPFEREVRRRVWAVLFCEWYQANAFVAY